MNGRTHLIAGVILGVMAGGCLRRWVDAPRAWLLWLGFVLYLTDAVLWVVVLQRTRSLARSGALWGALSLVLSTCVAVMLFGERMTPKAWVGVFLSLGAIWCLDE